MALAAPERSLFVAQRCNNLHARCLPHRHQRRQHPKVAVPMLAWQRYQCRNPIQKLAWVQAQLNRPLQPRAVPMQRRPRQLLAHLRPTSRPYQSLTGKQLKPSVVRSQEDRRPYAVLDINHHTAYVWGADASRCIDCTCGTWNSTQLFIEAIGCYTYYFYSNPLGAKSPIELSTASSREIPVLS